MAHSPTTELKAAGPTAVDVSQKEPFLSVSLLSWTFCYSNRHWPAQPRTAQFCHLVSGLSLSFLAHSLPCVQHILSPVKQGTHWHETNVSNHIMAKKIKKDSSRRGTEGTMLLLYTSHLHRFPRHFSCRNPFSSSPFHCELSKVLSAIFSSLPLHQSSLWLISYQTLGLECPVSFPFHRNFCNTIQNTVELSSLLTQEF